MSLRHFLLCCLTMLLPLFAQAQSADDVHIVPRNPDTKTNAPPEMQAATGASSLYARMRPFRVKVDLVLVPVTVFDAMQHPVTELSKQDFALFEDQKRQQIQYFSAEAEPVSIALLIDVSKSMTDKIDTEKAAILEFFKNADPQDEYFGITFSSRPRLLVGPTQSVDDLQTKLTTVEPAGPTAMLDAVNLAERELRAGRYKRRAILIISDGGDNASRYSLKETKKSIQESDVQIYAIGLFETFFFNTLEERLGKKWLSEITDATGGRTITVDSRTKLPQAAAEISREIRNQYILGYHPSNKVPNRWRKIKVQLVASAGVEHSLRTYYKKGYLTSEQ